MSQEQYTKIKNLKYMLLNMLIFKYAEVKIYAGNYRNRIKKRMDAGEDVQLIDVRQPDEYAFTKTEGAKLIPIGDIMRRMDKLDENRETVIHCKMGDRSAKAIEVLEKAGFKGKMSNLSGGITAWSNEVDRKFRNTK